MSTPFDRMQQEFTNKEYRHEYADGFLNSKIATQLKVLREQMEWTQSQLAKEVGMQQARISVLEDVDYSAWSISTLRRYARAFDLWLDVEFKEFGALWPELKKLNRKSLERRSFNNDPAFHERVTASSIPSYSNADSKTPTGHLICTFGVSTQNEQYSKLNPPLKLPTIGGNFELTFTGLLGVTDGGNTNDATASGQSILMHSLRVA